MILILILNYIFLVYKIKNLVEANLVINEFSILINNKNKLYLNLFLLFIFIIYFFFYVRLLKVFFPKNSSINIFFLFERIVSYCYDSILLSLILILFLIIIFTILNYIVFFFAKKSFLRIHYFLLFRNFFYSKFIRSFSFIDLFFYKSIKNIRIYKFIYFLFAYGFKIYILIYFFKSLIFDNGNICLDLIPYYSLYYFIFRIYVYLCKNFNYDFDLTLANFYYPNINYYIIVQNFSIVEYQKYLLFGFSEYYFADCIYLNFPWLIKSNWLIADTMKYTLNSYPHDFHTRISNEKPIFYSY